jgi:sn-glycerol 3-phosphate transport system substrate-binding protein
MDETVTFEWGFGMMPGGPAGRAVSHGGSNLAIGADATPEQKRAAWEFISYVTSTRKAAEFHMATGYVPSKVSVLEVPEVLTFHTKHPSWLVSAEQIQFAQPTSCVGLNALSYDPVMNEALDRILINGEDPATVLAEAAAELQAEIDELKSAGSLIQ